MLSRPDLFSVPTPPAFALTVLTVIPHLKTTNGVQHEVASDAGVSDGLVKTNGVGGKHDGDVGEANAVTKEVYELINARGQIFLTSGVVNGVYAIRVVSANPKAEQKFIRRAFDIIVQTAEEVLAKSVGA